MQMTPVTLVAHLTHDTAQMEVSTTIAMTYPLPTTFKYLEAPPPIVAHHTQSKFPMVTHKPK